MQTPLANPLKNLSHLFALSLSLSILLTFPLIAQEEAPKTKAEIQALIDTYEENPGLISGAERTAYQKRFPFCNEFLKIQWLPKQEGKSQRGWRFDEYSVTTEGNVSKTKRVYYFVEISEKSGAITYYSLDTFIKVFPNTWKTLLQEVEVGYDKYAYQLVYKFKNYKTELFGSGGSYGYKNICAVTPDEKRAVFYTMNKAGKVLTQEEKEALGPKLELEKNRYDKDPKQFYSSARVLDINHDGKPDFVSHELSMDEMIFSHPEGYRRIQTQREKRYIIVSPGVTDYSCSPMSGTRFDLDDIYYSTDGPNLFHTSVDLNNTCNLTKLTTPKSKGE